MNRGNLAEDPRTGLSSSSRYSRNGGETNSLLYVDSSSVRKERKAAERRSGNRNSAVKGNHNSKRKTSDGRGLANSHMDRLEVGSDGRLFQVRESSDSPVSVSKAAQDHAAAASGNSLIKQTVKDIRPAIAADAFSDALKNDDAHSLAANNAASAAEQTTYISENEPEGGRQSLVNGSGQETGQRRSKPERSYLTQSNPLLKTGKTRNRIRIQSNQPGKQADTPDAAQPEVSAAQSEPSAARHGSAAAQPELAAVQPDAAITVADIIPAGEGAPARSGIRAFFRRFRIPVIVSAVALASAGYGYTAWYYRNRFYPGTEFFGIPESGQSVYDVKAAVKSKVDSYSLMLETRKPLADGDSAAASSNQEENIITAEDVGMIYNDNGEIDSVMKNQRSWAWPVMMLAALFGDKNSALETSYDNSMVSDALGRLPCMQKENMISPQDAQVVLTDDGAQVQTEIYGTTLNREKTEEAVKDALNTGSTYIDLDKLGLYENPKINSSDLSLTSQAMTMNKVLGAKILMRFGSRTEVINSETISKFLDKKGNTYTLNEDKVRRYVEKLAVKYDTLQCERDFFTSIGTKITLEAGIGDYGWLMDQEATFEELLEAIRGQKKTTMNPVYTQEAYCRDEGDIGNTYVEISLTNQTMWFYKNGSLIVETPVVTGNPYAGHETPSGGVWSLKGRMRNQTLVGQGYASPVDYWMPFNGGVGIHDMQSRAWFGGTIYLGSGSHGCVNTPLAAVKLIYDQIEEGVPVVVYKDESEEALAQVTGPTDVWTLNSMIEDLYGTVDDDGIGSIVSWSRSAAAQAAQAAAAQTTSSGTPAT